MESGILSNITSFTDDEGGNIQAEELFKKKILGMDCPESEVDSFIEDGSFSKGDDEVLLAHS
jgi:hypothetical protein